jgi:hypothetical protein
MASAWQYTTSPSRPRAPEVVLVVFSQGPLARQVELSLSTFGAPSEQAIADCSLRTIDRRIDPTWFDAWRQGSLRDIAAKDLGDQLAELDAADHAHVIACTPATPSDLGYLQGAWALARYLVARGASVVLDAHAMTYLRDSALAPADAPLDVAREVRVVFESSSTRPDGAHALHTRGMRKFGAPDLVALCSDADARLVGSAMSELADGVARGTDLATPRHAIHIAPGVTWVAIEDEHRIGALLQLDNEARVIVDDTGHHLVGVLGRLPVPPS